MKKIGTVIRGFDFSRMGLSLMGTYAFVTAMAIGCALWASASGDPKGYFVLLQLPVALQLAAMPEGLLRQLGEISWVMIYLTIWPLTALALYTLGQCLGCVLKPRPSTGTLRR